MNSLLRAGLAAVVLVLATAATSAERSARDWLGAMTDAMRDTNYTGVFVYRYGDQLDTMRIVHRATDGGERERLVSLDGVAREIIRDDAQVTCFLPDSHSVMVDRRTVRNPLSNMVPEDTDTLGEQYTLEILGKGRVAGRDAIRLGIRPMDRYRYGYQLFIDREHGLLLRADLHAGGDRPVEQIMFTEISTPEHIPDEWLEPTMSGEGFTWYRHPGNSETTETGESPWTVETLPPGFRMVMQRRHQLPGREVMVEHRLYSDGLAAVSVYIERTGSSAHAFHGRSSMGAMNAFGRTVGDHQIAVVGEVPAITVETIGRSIQRGQQPAP